MGGQYSRSVLRGCAARTALAFCCATTTEAPAAVAMLEIDVDAGGATSARPVLAALSLPVTFAPASRAPSDLERRLAAAQRRAADDARSFSSRCADRSVKRNVWPCHIRELPH